MSLEQAKAIKQKREFAQELEDIKDFEQKVVGGSESRSGRKLGSNKEDTESSEEDEEDEEDQQPRGKRTVCGPLLLRSLWRILTEQFFPAERPK